MFFALFDYLQYRRETGSYGVDQKDAAMGHFAGYGVVSETIIKQLQEGDLIYTQRLGSVLSWGTMYFASSSVDHVAIYKGDGKIAHMTLNGVRTHTLSEFAKGARVLPVRPNERAKQAMVEQIKDDCAPEPAAYFRRLPAKWQLYLVAAGLVVGHYPERYKWYFFADILLLAAVIDLVLWLGWGVFTALPVATLFGIWTAYNLIKHRFGEVQTRTFSHPDIGYHAFFKHGGIIFTSPRSLVVSSLGLVPIDLFNSLMTASSLGGKCTDDGTSDNLQEINEGVCNSVENDNFVLVPHESKDHEREEN